MGEDEVERFDRRYRTTGTDIFLEIEREVLGVDYQATGYTTREEADRLGELLALGPSSRLLDLGSGCGYPGLYLARQTGCTVITVDPVAAGAVASASRSIEDGLTGRHLSVVGCGQHLPLRPRAFDAVVHVDVMC